MTYYDPSYAAASLAVSALIFIGVLLFIDGLINRMHTKSRRYREFLSDMYVAAKIRIIAKKDDVNLEEETLNFFRHEKYIKRASKAFDQILEDELKEKMEEDFDNAKTKANKKV